ncbi:hypothetical protein B0O99DRAFT_606289 [Bisporella sp. PMI_857]|nr:hypothetical protein B0O99DRAFT_606289 [Bisporella sp. PMI_857]
MFAGERVLRILGWTIIKRTRIERIFSLNIGLIDSKYWSASRGCRKANLTFLWKRPPRTTSTYSCLQVSDNAQYSVLGLFSSSSTSICLRRNFPTAGSQKGKTSSQKRFLMISSKTSQLQHKRRLSGWGAMASAHSFEWIPLIGDTPSQSFTFR